MWLQCSKACSASWLYVHFCVCGLVCAGTEVVRTDNAVYDCVKGMDYAGTDLEPPSTVTATPLNATQCATKCNQLASCSFFVLESDGSPSTPGNCWAKKDYLNGGNGATAPNARDYSCTKGEADAACSL